MNKKIFDGIELTWPKLIIGAIIAGIITAVIAIVPYFRSTSFDAITVTFEVWILFGIFIIMNSKSNIDSALKCFVFFLISQPLVYLIQVPFNVYGWGIFIYYRYWFIWTILCLPMGYIGYFMKMNKWWGYLILLPMILLTASSYSTYLSDFIFYMPKYLLICLFCIWAIIFYPVLIFDDKRIKIAGSVIGLIIVIVLTIYGFLNPPVYSAEILANGDEYKFDDTYNVYLEDDKYGDVKIIQLEGSYNYYVHADFKKAGKTTLILESSDNKKTRYDISIERHTYEIVKK